MCQAPSPNLNVTEPMNIKNLAPKELLRLSGAVICELRARGIVRTENSPVGDYAEWLVAESFGWERVKSSVKGHDLVDPVSGLRYEVKSRRASKKIKSPQLSAIRDIQGSHFDFLIVIIFDQDFNVLRALKVPHAVVHGVGKHNVHTNSLLLHADKNLAQQPGVEDITSLIVVK